MSIEEANIFNELLSKGYRFYIEPIDHKKPTPYRPLRNTVIVLETPNSLKRGSVKYPQTEKGREEAAKEIKRLSKEVYRMHLNKK